MKLFSHVTLGDVGEEGWWDVSVSIVLTYYSRVSARSTGDFVLFTGACLARKNMTGILDHSIRFIE